ncbi:MAG: aminodeoxychorismate lyase [Cycloclasticus sp.]|nr:MAG: aminodeoxychorismate lyase [Cycloclasticus sp.]
MLINGKSATLLSPLDRGFQYGDGLFETILIESACPIFLVEHLARLEKGCEVLNIPMPDATLITDELYRVIANEPSGVAKIILTRGIGTRGFLPPSSPEVTRVVSFNSSETPLPQKLSSIELTTCDINLSRQPLLAGIKHLNQLERVLARSSMAEIDRIEGLMLDTEDNVIEGIMSNLFIAKNGILKTPALKYCGVSGVIRNFLMTKAKLGNIECLETELSLEDIRSADEVFMTNSLMPVRVVKHFNDEGNMFNKEQIRYSTWALDSVIVETKHQINTIQFP